MSEEGMNFQSRICRLPQNIFGCVCCWFPFSRALIVESLTLTFNGTEYKKKGDIRRDDVRNYVNF